MKNSNLWRGAVVGLIALMAIGASACGRRARAIANGGNARQIASLVQQAARDTGCQPGQLSPGQIGPDVYTVTGCTQPVEYLLQCGRRRHCAWVRVATLNEAAAPYLQCQPQMIQQQPTQAPNVRYATGCGQQAAFTIQCDGRGCGWMMSGPPQGMAPQVAVQPQQPQGPVVVQPGAPVVAQGEVAAVQSQLQTQREAIMSCVDVGSFNLTVRWTAQGVVQIALPPELAGTAAEGCIQAAIGTLRVVTQHAGQAVIPLR